VTLALAQKNNSETRRKPQLQELPRQEDEEDILDKLPGTVEMIERLNSDRLERAIYRLMFRRAERNLIEKHGDNDIVRDAIKELQFIEEGILDDSSNRNRKKKIKSLNTSPPNIELPRTTDKRTGAFLLSVKGNKSFSSEDDLLVC
jgi:hypothetical protein